MEVAGGRSGRGLPAEDPGPGGPGPASKRCTVIGCFGVEKTASHRPPARRQVSLHAEFNP